MSRPSLLEHKVLMLKVMLAYAQGKISKKH